MEPDRGGVGERRIRGGSHQINLYTGKTGVDGDTFKNRYLMDKHNIQVNRTSRNRVLFMTNIGTTRGPWPISSKCCSPSRTSWRPQQRTEPCGETTAHCPDPLPYPRDTAIAGLQPFPRFVPRAVPGVPGGDPESLLLAYSELNCEYVKLPQCRTRCAEAWNWSPQAS